jgi:hypothetical protein
MSLSLSYIANLAKLATGKHKPCRIRKLEAQNPWEAPSGFDAIWAAKVDFSASGEGHMRSIG